MSSTSTSTMEKTRTTTVVRKKYRVFMHNDESTSFEIVIKILEEVFQKTNLEAEAIALAIHKSGPKGKKVVGEYSKTIAEAKRKKGLAMAKAAGYHEFNITVK